MNKKELRQEKLFNLLKDQGTGAVCVSDDLLSALMGVSKKTISRDLTEMNYRKIIVKQTKLITNKQGQTIKHRDIIIPGEPQRKFTIDQHRFLSNVENHKIWRDEDTNEVLWFRTPDGIHWERSMQDKEFNSTKQAYEWMYYAIGTHNNNYKYGDRYSNRNTNP